ncbi:PLP-dependent aminotransferase family protein [Xanthomonas maliensis]|uniref:aminotransferase-like domain-containing protein n=1 Tax=Xanthomonas maliensis TaxID=1321368 RepID=UPI0003B4AF80|nr:PLP-dependent aminotransferase family protein [Xanthomonas maliensis]KAB7763058.1 PLP-dependent aminotransferase family protein [Xanthomonas maliensis]
MAARQPAPTATLPARGDRLEVMNFLNEVSARYPHAVSFVSGRPSDIGFDLSAWLQSLPEFSRHFAQRTGTDHERALSLIAQYGRTQGILDELIAGQLRQDERIVAEPSQVLVTAGCQEAMLLCVTELCQAKGDVILARNPSYIGITGVADIHGIEIVAFNQGDHCNGSSDAEALRRTLLELKAAGKRARVLYLVPDFDNPTGILLSRQAREAIVQVCTDHHVVILEDNPYGMFGFTGDRVASMAALDRHGCVIYLGTYSKTLCPAVRVGFAVLPRQLLGDAAAAAELQARLVRRKSFYSLNTSQIGQAIVGGVLLAHGGSLRPLIAAPHALYRRNRDHMLECLQRELGHLAPQVHWNTPAGGFFLVATLPFAFGAEEAELCARQFGVLVMPLTFFALDGGCRRQVRLAYSNVASEEIAQGIAQFAAFVRLRLHAQAASATPALTMHRLNAR